MNKQLRNNLLSKLGDNQKEGTALIEWLSEQIVYLRNGQHADPQNFEIDGKANLKAADKLEELFKILKPKKDNKLSKDKNPYL